MRCGAARSVCSIWRTQELEQANLALRDTMAAREHAEQALRESERRTRLILDTAFNAFVAMTAQGKIAAWNAEAERLFGWSAQEAIGRTLAETIIPPQYRTAHEHGLARYLKSGDGPVINKRIEIAALHRDGHQIPVELVIWP